MPSDPRSLLPLKPVVLRILLVLTEQERHGWDLVRELERHGDQRGRILPGNLYRTLREMRAAGLIGQSLRRPPAEHDDERRRYFRVTSFGRAVAKAEIDRLHRVVADAGALDLARQRRG